MTEIESRSSPVCPQLLLTRATALLLAASLVSLAKPGRGQSADPPHALVPTAPSPMVLVLGERPELQARIHGQTSDLKAKVLWRVSATATSWNDQIQTALLAAHNSGADLVVWLTDIDHAPDQLNVHETRAFVAVLLRDAERLYARQLGPPLSSATEEETSAILELAALTARSALEALSTPEVLGVPVAKLERATPVRSVTTPTYMVQDPPTPDTVSSNADEGTPSRAVVGLGLSSHLDGVTALGLPSPELRAGVELAPLRIALAGQWGPQREVDLTDATLTLARHVLALQAELALTSDAQPLVPLFQLSGGAVVFQRTTETHGPGASGTPAAVHWSPLLHSGVALEYRPPTQGVGQALQLSIGVDIVPLAPTIEFLTGQGTLHRRFQVNAVQPRANLLWLARW